MCAIQSRFLDIRFFASCKHLIVDFSSAVNVVSAYEEVPAWFLAARIVNVIVIVCDVMYGRKHIKLNMGLFYFVALVAIFELDVLWTVESDPEAQVQDFNYFFWHYLVIEISGPLNKEIKYTFCNDSVKDQLLY